MVKLPKVPPNPRIFHITHLNNLPSILNEGGLHCDAVRIQRNLSVTSIGHLHIKNRRLSRAVTVAAGGFLGDYVPFNFCERSVMLYVVGRGHQDYGGGQDQILHLVSTIDRAIRVRRPWAFTDRHAELAHAAYFTDKTYLDQIDWQVMHQRYWADPLTKELRQAEFLVHQFFPWEAVETIGVRSDTVKSQVEQALQGATAHCPRVDIHPDWYY